MVLDIHLVPNHVEMQRLIDHYDMRTAPAIALPRNEHQKLVSISQETEQNVAALFEPGDRAADLRECSIEEIILRIYRNAGKGALDAVTQDLTEPPGKGPAKDLVEESEWYRALGEKEQSFVDRVIKRGIVTALFGFFCVLDGVSTLEATPEKGEFELVFCKEGQRYLLNQKSSDCLHDIFSVITQRE